jgi:hypothetical protein
MRLFARLAGGLAALLLAFQPAYAGLETATYINGLVATNPVGTDPKSAGDDHLRLIKSTLKATFPNITGAVTPTHGELNYVTGVTSAIQTQLNTKGAIAGQAWTGIHTFTTQSAGNNSTRAATTAYVDTGLALKANLASPALTGTPTGPTAAPGTNTTQLATTAFATQLAFQAALPVQSGNSGKFLTTDGSNASWSSINNAKSAQSSNASVAATDRYKHFVLTSTATLSLLAAATAGDGFLFYVRNDGTGIWTIDPNASETIDGLTTVKIYPGEGFAIICDGSNWRSFGRDKGPILVSTTTIGAAVPNVDFETGFDDTEFTRFQLVGEGVSPDASVNMFLRVKKSGAYQASAYAYQDATGTNQTSQAEIKFYNVLGASDLMSFEATILNPGSSGGAVGLLVRASGTGGGDEAKGTQTTAAAVQGVRILPSSGNLDAGTFRLYGFR